MYLHASSKCVSAVCCQQFTVVWSELLELSMSKLSMQGCRVNCPPPLETPFTLPLFQCLLMQYFKNSKLILCLAFWASQRGFPGTVSTPNWVFVQTAGGYLGSDGGCGQQPSRPRSAAQISETKWKGDRLENVEERWCYRSVYQWLQNYSFSFPVLVFLSWKTAHDSSSNRQQLCGHFSDVLVKQHV